MQRINQNKQCFKSWEVNVSLKKKKKEHCFFFTLFGKVNIRSYVFFIYVSEIALKIYYVTLNNLTTCVTLLYIYLFFFLNEWNIRKDFHCSNMVLIFLYWWCQIKDKSCQIPQRADFFCRFFNLDVFWSSKLTFVSDQVRKTTLATSWLAALLSEDFPSSCWILWLLCGQILDSMFYFSPLLPPSSHHPFSPLQALTASYFLPEHPLYSPAYLCPLSISAPVITAPSDTERVRI